MKPVIRIFDIVAVTLILCMAGLLIGLWGQLPTRIPLGFDEDAHVTAWGSRALLLAFPAAGVLFYGLLELVSRRLTGRLPGQRAELTGVFISAMRTHLMLMVLVCFLYMLGTARNGHPVAGFAVAMAICIFMALMVAGFFILYRRILLRRS